MTESVSSLEDAVYFWCENGSIKLIQNYSFSTYKKTSGNHNAIYG